MRWLDCICAMLLTLAPACGRAQLFGAPRLDPAFCNQKSFRETAIYIDDMVMIDGQTGWAKRIADKLRATLSPGEKVAVIRLSPASGESHEVWNACWPSYTQPALERIAQQTFIFERNPLDRLDEQQKLFLGGLNDALAQIYLAGRRPAAVVHVDPQSPPVKQIVRALANDEGRFSASTVTIRAIMYSDLAESSDLGSVFKPSLPLDFGRRLGTYLRRAVFYDFGVGTDVGDDLGFSDRARVFWGAAIGSMAATVGGIDTDLNVANVIPVNGTTVRVTVKMAEEPLDGRLSLLFDRDGTLVDSWLGISRLGSTRLNGSFVCVADPGVVCRLDATTATRLVTTSPTEEIHMRGAASDQLRGTIGVRGAATLFDIAAAPGS